MAGYLTTTVKARETLQEVADRLHITREELAHENDLGTGAGLREGQVLKYLPTGGFLTYTVRRGQTLDEVASELGVDVAELAHFNDMGTGAGLRTGQVLKYKPAAVPGWAPPKQGTVVRKTTIKPTATTTTAQDRTAATTNPPNPAAWQPWVSVQNAVNGRFQVEIQSALQFLDGELKAAGRVLDTAITHANAAAAPLESRAMTAYGNLMQSADQARQTILTPALAAYDKAVTTAHATYQQMLTDAETTYKQASADVAQAQADGQLITGSTTAS